MVHYVYVVRLYPIGGNLYEKLGKTELDRLVKTVEDEEFENNEYELDMGSQFIVIRRFPFPSKAVATVAYEGICWANLASGDCYIKM